MLWRQEGHLSGPLGPRGELRLEGLAEGAAHHRGQGGGMLWRQEGHRGLCPCASAQGLPEDPNQVGEGLEKKFSGKHVVFVAQRRILPKPTRKANKLKQKRPRSRTLMAVHTAILDDLV